VVELTAVVGLVVGCSGVLVAAAAVVVVVLAQGEQNQAESADPPTLLLNSQSTRTESQINGLTIRQQKKALSEKHHDYDLVVDVRWRITARVQQFW